LIYHWHEFLQQFELHGHSVISRELCVEAPFLVTHATLLAALLELYFLHSSDSADLFSSTNQATLSLTLLAPLVFCYYRVLDPPVQNSTVLLNEVLVAPAFDQQV
jgi:hypothetical protein